MIHANRGSRDDASGILDVGESRVEGACRMKQRHDIMRKHRMPLKAVITLSYRGLGTVHVILHINSIL